MKFSFRDADETIAWIMEKDAILSTDDYGRDLASVQALRRKHEGVERDLAALNEKVSFGLACSEYLASWLRGLQSGLSPLCHRFNP